MCRVGTTNKRSRLKINGDKGGQDIGLARQAKNLLDHYNLIDKTPNFLT